jgi:hypothetical protein
MNSGAEDESVTESRLDELRILLMNLPDSVPEAGLIPEYPFGNNKYELDADWIYDTGSEAGALNRDLEIIFKDRSDTAGSRVIKFHEKGPSLTGVVDAIKSYALDGGEVLGKWLKDLIYSAKIVYQNENQVSILSCK